MEHFRKDDAMPAIFKWSANFIQRVGYPIFISLVLCYVLFVNMNKNTQALNDVKEVLIGIKLSLDDRRP